MADFASQGALKPLDTFIDLAAYKADSPPGYVEKGAAGGKQVGVIIKASVKGLIWFDPKVYKGGVPTTWDDLNAKATAALASLTGTKEWCVGLESGAATRLAGHRLDRGPRPAPGRRRLLQHLGGGQGQVERTRAPECLQGVRHGRVAGQRLRWSADRHATNFGDGGNQLFTTPPGCLFHHQASFITDFFIKQGHAPARRLRLLPIPGHQRPVHRRHRGRR